MGGLNFFCVWMRMETDGRGDVTCLREKLVPPHRAGLPVHGGKATGRPV